MFGKFHSILVSSDWYHVAVLGLFIGVLFGHLYYGDLVILRKLILVTMMTSVFVLSAFAGYLIHKDRRGAGKRLAIIAAISAGFTDLLYLFQVDDFLVLVSFNVSAIALLLAIVRIAAGIVRRSDQ